MKSENEQPKRDLPERTFEFARRVVKLCQLLDQTPGVSRPLADQLLRAEMWIGANSKKRKSDAITYSEGETPHGFENSFK